MGGASNAAVGGDRTVALVAIGAATIALTGGGSVLLVLNPRALIA